MEDWFKSEPVRKWFGSLRESTRKDYVYRVRPYFEWLQKTKRVKSLKTTLDEARKNQDKSSEQLDWLQEYVQNNIKGSKKTKLNLYNAIRSLYERNRVSLPSDKSFRVQADKPKSIGKLDLGSLRKILQGFTAQPRERAIFTIMFQSPWTSP